MSRMLNIIEVKRVLGLSPHEVIRLVQTGQLRAYRYVGGGGPVTRESVTLTTQGLRFREADVEELLEQSLIK